MSYHFFLVPICSCIVINPIPSHHYYLFYLLLLSRSTNRQFSFTHLLQVSWSPFPSGVSIISTAGTSHPAVPVWPVGYWAKPLTDGWALVKCCWMTGKLAVASWTYTAQHHSSECEQDYNSKNHHSNYERCLCVEWWACRNAGNRHSPINWSRWGITWLGS